MPSHTLSKPAQRPVFSTNALKWIAIAAMTLDHIAWAVFPGYSLHPLALALHLVGRITCPILCFCIAEGYHHTRSRGRYTARLFLFALPSHFAYRFFAADFSGWRSFLPFQNGALLDQTSVMWALAWGLVMLRISGSRRVSETAKVPLILLCCLAALPSDWSCIASLWILAFGTNRGNTPAGLRWMLLYVSSYAVVYFFQLDRVYGLLQLGVLLAAPILLRYNGTRGTGGALLKWGFYLYYPLHLVLLGLLRHALS